LSYVCRSSQREGFARIPRSEAIVNRLSVIALVGFLALEACSAAGDVPERPEDAGRDVKTSPRADAQSADRLDASGGSYADETSGPPGPDAETPDTSSPPPDSGAPPSDGARPPDGIIPPPSDAPPRFDAGTDQTAPSCLVTFTVNGVSWSAPEGGADARGTRVVRLVGDAPNIGAWAPTAGVLLGETAPGTWSGTATFRDQQLTEFKFVKLDGITPEWESWLPFDSNRSLRVECSADGGVLRDAADVGADNDAFIGADAAADMGADGDGVPPDAAVDTRASDTASGSLDGDAADGGRDAPDSSAPGDGGVVPVPARGRSYVGSFGVRPLDATK
jgi:hypothetical protein